MQRRDVLRGALWLAGGSVLSGAGFGDCACVDACPSEAGMLGIRLERDADMIWPLAARGADDLWWLPAGQWLDSEMYAAFIHGRAGRGLFAVLDAGNHCLLGEALRIYGGCVQDQTRQRLVSGEWRYLLYATV